MNRHTDTTKLLLLLSGLLVSACSDAEPQPAADQTGDTAQSSVEETSRSDARATADERDEISAAIRVELVDTAVAPAIAGQDGWNYQQSAEADLNGDGRAERILLTARVESYRGRLAWDDGQPWQIYIQDPDGQRTYVYSRRLQLGTLSMRITSGAEDSKPAIVFIEHTPDQLNVYEASYEAPGRASTMLQFQRDLDPRGDLASPRLPN